MKHKIITVLVSGILLVGFAASFSGCTSAQPGQTAAEVKRKQIRLKRLNRQMMADDLESVFQYDRPSKLSELHIR